MTGFKGKKRGSSGVYSKVCPVNEVDEEAGTVAFLNMDKLSEEELRDKLWLCTSCFLCEEGSFKEPSPRRLSINERRKQRLEDKPKMFRGFLLKILEEGYVFKMTEVQEEERRSLGLPPLPKSGKVELRVLIKHLEDTGDTAKP